LYPELGHDCPYAWAWEDASGTRVDLREVAGRALRGEHFLVHWVVHWVVADEPLVEGAFRTAGKLLLPVEAQSGADPARQDVHLVVVPRALPYEVLAPAFARREKSLLAQEVVWPAW